MPSSLTTSVRRWTPTSCSVADRCSGDRWVSAVSAPNGGSPSTVSRGRTRRRAPRGTGPSARSRARAGPGRATRRPARPRRPGARARPLGDDAWFAFGRFVASARPRPHCRRPPPNGRSKRVGVPRRMFGRGFRIATIRGVPVNVDSSWIWIAVLLRRHVLAQLDREFPTSPAARRPRSRCSARSSSSGPCSCTRPPTRSRPGPTGSRSTASRWCSSADSPRPGPTRKGRGAAFAICRARAGDEPRPVGRLLGARARDRELRRPAARAVQLRGCRQPVHGGLQRAARPAALTAAGCSSRSCGA